MTDKNKKEDKKELAVASKKSDLVAAQTPSAEENFKISDIQPSKRAAIFMVNLPKEDAAAILKHLTPKQVSKITESMAKLKEVTRPMLDCVLDDFIEQVDTATSLGIGNDEHIRQMLIEAIGEEKANNMLDRILNSDDTKGLDNLKWVEPKQVADIIRLEHPQIQSIILSYLDPDHASEVLAFFDQRTRLDLILRISDLDTVHPVALRELNDILERQFVGNAQSSSRQLGGVKIAADMMNFLDSSIEAELMTDLKERDPELGQTIQDLMFVFDNLIDVDDRGMQMLLREISSDVLITALKGADNDVKTKVFKNMSKRASELLQDDLEAKGPVKVSEVEGAQKEIISIARRMAEEGNISLGKGGEEMI